MSVTTTSAMASTPSTQASRLNRSSRDIIARDGIAAASIRNFALSTTTIHRTAGSPKNAAIGPASPTDNTNNPAASSIANPLSCAMSDFERLRFWMMAALSPNSLKSCTKPT